MDGSRSAKRSLTLTGCDGGDADPVRPMPASRPADDPRAPTTVRGAVPLLGVTGRRAVPLLAGALALSTLWAGGATYYLLFHDELLARIADRQRETRIAYEERVSTLQAQVERAAADRVAAQGGVEGRLAALAERQALIEKRQGLLAALGGGPVETGSLPVAPAALPAVAPPVIAGPAPRKPFPTPDLPDFPMRGSDMRGSDLRMRGADRAEVGERGLARRLSGLDARLDGLAAAQARALDAVAVRALRGADRIRSVMLQAGLDPARFERAAPGSGGASTGSVGGPLVPLGSDAFEVAATEARRSVVAEQQLRRALAALPLRRPLDVDAVATSGFGARLDPFTRGYALHTGLDLRAEYGTAARATAPGRVVAAEYAGGYGNMVEVDHGRGIVTRYAHLAAFSVVPGQSIEAGGIIGRVGSTGRSTGSHLHYETRIDGEPVDPQRFLRAGAGYGPDPSPEVEAFAARDGSRP